MSGGSYFYLMSSLPSLPELGEAPPIGLAELRERASDFPAASEVVDAVLLEQDLLERQSILAGETRSYSGAVLSDAQVHGDEPLPECLQAEQEPNRPVGDDQTWERYFRHVNAVGRRRGSAFLHGLVGFEVSLRNALVIARARVLELDAEAYLVATELSDAALDITSVVARWSSAENPLAALKALDRARWEWLQENGRYYSFHVDELAAYARALVLLHRWQAMQASQGQEQQA
jgi:hypothetical protein